MGNQVPHVYSDSVDQACQKCWTYVDREASIGGLSGLPERGSVKS